MSGTVGGPTLHGFCSRPQLWCRLRLLRTMLQRTQHFIGGLKIPTWARLRRAATSRPAAFDFSQVKNQPVPGRAQGKSSFPILRHPVVRWLRRLVLTDLQRAPVGRFGFASRSINSATYFPLPAFKSVSGNFRNWKTGSVQQLNLRTVSQCACGAYVGHKSRRQSAAIEPAPHQRNTRQKAEADPRPPVRLASLERAAPPRKSFSRASHPTPAH